MLSRKFSTCCSQPNSVLLHFTVTVSSVTATSRRFLVSRTSETQKSYRNLLPRNYFVGGKAPKSIPKEATTTVVNAAPKFANAGLIMKWRDKVLKEFIPDSPADQSSSSPSAKMKVSFAATSSVKSHQPEQHQQNQSPSSPSSSAPIATIPPAGSTKEGKFKCSSCSGVWFARIRERNDPQQDTGCPHCVRADKQKMILEFAAPKVAAEWDIARNKMFSTLTPSTTPVTSEAHLWWNCDLCAGNFVACVKDRVEEVSHCPTCVEAQLDPLLNEKRSKYRREMLKKETQNKRFVESTAQQGQTSPNEEDQQPIRNPLNKLEAARADVLAPWACSKCGCSWKGSSFHQRLEQHTLCPSCSGQVVTSANSLVETRPDVVRAIAKHQKELLRSDALNQLTIYSPTPVWWRCFSCKLEYRMSVRQRCQYAGVWKDGQTFGQSVANQSFMNPCPHCQRARRVIALENQERGNVDGYVSATKTSLYLSGGEKVAPTSKQHIASRGLNGPN